MLNKMKKVNKEFGLGKNFGSFILVLGVVVITQAQSRALAAGSGPKGISKETDGIFQTPAEFQALRNASGRLYSRSVEYWQRVLRNELQVQEMKESQGVQQMRTEAAELQSAYIREFSEASDSVAQQRVPERDLVVLSAGLRALAMIESRKSNAGSWSAARDVLEPLRRELRKFSVRPDIRVFVGSLLVAADLNLDKAVSAVATAEDILEAVELGQSSGTGIRGNMNHSLLTMLYGDALFAQFRYRDSLTQYNKTYKIAGTSGDESLLRLARMRVFWAAYRSGDFKASIAAFQETCSVDVLHWENEASTEERDLFEEMGRMAGIVLLRSNSQLLADDFANEQGSGSCRSRALVSLIERQQSTGRFDGAIATFKRYFSVLSSGSEFAAASLMARSAADRDRPGITPGEWRGLVALAAPVLGRNSLWEQMFKTPGERRNRERFVKDYVLEAADSFYNDAGKGQEREFFQRASQLYDIRLLEEDRFPERARTEFRLAFALAQLGRRKASSLRIESALQSGLIGDDRKAAFELRCELAKKDAWEERSEPRLAAWAEKCLELVRAFPTARALQELTDAAHDLGQVNSGGAAKAAGVLREGLSLVASRASELKQLGDRFLVVLRELLVQSLGGEELFGAFSQSESLLRPAIGTARLAKFEQANYSSLVSFLAMLRSKGNVGESLRVMRVWLDSNRSNTFQFAARAEIVERLFELSNWKELEMHAAVLLDAPEAADQKEAQLKAGVDVDFARVRLLRALSQESRLEFEKAFASLSSVESDRAAQSSAVSARRLILERYADRIAASQQVGFMQRCLARDSGLSVAERSNAHLIEIGWLLAAQSSAAPVRAAEIEKSYERARGHLKSANSADVHTRALAAVVDAKLVLAGGVETSRPANPNGVDERIGKSRMEQRMLEMSTINRLRVRSIVSREIEIESLKLGAVQRQSLRGGSFAKLFGAVSRLPGSFVNPKAGLALAQSWIRLREGPPADVAAILAASLKSRAELFDESGSLSADEERDASTLIQLLVRHFGLAPKASDLIAFVGPNHPVLTDSSLYGIPARISEGVVGDTE
jgi:hypothetical protein